MSDVSSRYRDTYTEFAALLAYGIALIEAQAGHVASGDRQFYAERIFSKLVCHAITLKRLSPSPEPIGIPELWDISSCYAIARTLIETYEALAYVALDSISEEEQSFRILLWKLHAEERRREMLRLIGSNHPDVPNVDIRVVSLCNQLLAHPFLNTVGTDLQRKIRRGETPPYHLSRANRDAKIGINHEYHIAVTMHLSSHVHTHPFSVHQLFEFQAGNEECLRLMSVPLQYAAGFMAKSISGMIDIFTPRVPSTTPEFLRTLDIWNALLLKGIKNSG